MITFETLSSGNVSVIVKGDLLVGSLARIDDGCYYFFPYPPFVAAGMWTGDQMIKIGIELKALNYAQGGGPALSPMT